MADNINLSGAVVLNNYPETPITIKIKRNPQGPMPFTYELEPKGFVVADGAMLSHEMIHHLSECVKNLNMGLGQAHEQMLQFMAAEQASRITLAKN